MTQDSDRSDVALNTGQDTQAASEARKVVSSNKSTIGVDAKWLSSICAVVGGSLGMFFGGPLGGTMGMLAGTLYGGASEFGGRSIVRSFQKTRALFNSRKTGKSVDDELQEIKKKDANSKEARSFKRVATYLAFFTGQITVPLIATVSYYGISAGFKIKDAIFGKKAPIMPSVVDTATQTEVSQMKDIDLSPSQGVQQQNSKEAESSITTSSTRSSSIVEDVIKRGDRQRAQTKQQRVLAEKLESRSIRTTDL
ncbi:MAG: hypothetical protein RLZZ59_777 [Pseudomonadota bacterium]|jgi:hypothetical protein